MKKKIKTRKPDVRAWHELEPSDKEWERFFMLEALTKKEKETKVHD